MQQDPVRPNDPLVPQSMCTLVPSIHAPLVSAWACALTKRPVDKAEYTGSFAGVSRRESHSKIARNRLKTKRSTRLKIRDIIEWS
jgi:hypothetical protein